MKVLNLYAGIGGNRKLWTDVEVTAVELNEEIAGIYKDYFPQDEMIIADAHEYLLKHYKEYDFIWSSPPCQSHSDMTRMGIQAGITSAKFPDMNLWEEIIFLKKFSIGRFVIENVKPYYEPIIKPSIELQRHFFWSNFNIKPFFIDNTEFDIRKISSNSSHYGYDLSKYKINYRKAQILRNCVNPDLGLYILEQARGIIRSENVIQYVLFNDHPP